jgi:hypothetical protein
MSVSYQAEAEHPYLLSLCSFYLTRFWGVSMYPAPGQEEDGEADTKDHTGEEEEDP